MLQRNAISPTRSAMPMVLGIIAIVFAGFGLMGTGVLVLGPDEDMTKHQVTYEALGSYGTWVTVSALLSLGVFALHLTAGIFALRYSRRAPNLLTAYGVVALAFAILDIALAVALSPFDVSSLRFGDIIGPRIGLDVLAVPWPIVVLVLANLRRTREACTR
jgi:hypothetical protein